VRDVPVIPKNPGRQKGREENAEDAAGIELAAAEPSGGGERSGGNKRDNDGFHGSRYG